MEKLCKKNDAPSLTDLWQIDRSLFYPVPRYVKQNASPITVSGVGREAGPVALLKLWTSLGASSRRGCGYQ
jgi:hypothetical protein